MKGTGKVYGLRIDHYVDERRDPIKSTVAAARYLRDLYDLFGAWPLAMAAYNAGEGKVMRALHKAQVETFSDISKTKLIRSETKQYVPRIMAATVMPATSTGMDSVRNRLPLISLRRWRSLAPCTLRPSRIRPVFPTRSFDCSIRNYGVMPPLRIMPFTISKCRLEPAARLLS